MSAGTEPVKGRTWYERDLPVLLAAVQAIQRQPGSLLMPVDISKATGLPQDDVVRALINLGEKYLRIDRQDMFEDSVPPFVTVRGISADGLVAADVWPSPDALSERLVTAIERAIETTPTGSPQSAKLAALRSAATDLTVGTASNVLGGLLYHAMTGM